jgi:cytochrome c peroxidase
MTGMKTTIILMMILALSVVTFVGCESKKPTKTETARSSEPLKFLGPTARGNFLKARLGPLKEVSVPADNPLTAEKVNLGKLLFFDARLSGDQKTSCASCHRPEKAWADAQPRSVGVGKRRGRRNTPSLLNVAYYQTFYWDGRASSLEEQVLKALANPEEMAGSPPRAVKTIGSIEGYRPLFNAAFGSEEVTAERLAKAIASFERTLVTGTSTFDRFLQGTAELTDEQKKGMELFLRRADCVGCHRGPFFTNEEFKPGGIYIHPDWGRHNWTKQEYDRGKFRVPSLRNVALTAPYFHNGSEPSLEQAAFFRSHGKTRKELEKLGYNQYVLAHHFSDDEIKQMTAFMQSLTGDLPKVEAPPELPK